MIKSSMLIWLAIIPLSIINGMLREALTAPLVGVKLAVLISGVILGAMILIMCLLFIPRFGKGKNKDYINIGLLQFTATIFLSSCLDST